MISQKNQTLPEKEFSSVRLRKKFLDFFAKKGHKIIPSSSLLPPEQSVLFTTAGIQQFKEYYLGKPSPYGNRVASCQKCFRTSDIEEVGDTSHLTFFEMLGNFSFGGYFKKEAIKWALEFLLKDCGLNVKNLWFTVFKGEGEVPADDESLKIWQELGVSKGRIYGFGREDNFWGPTGEEGPCGPNTELHYDLTGKPCRKGRGCLPNCDCRRFIEIWNLVFNEYYQNRQKCLRPLKQKGVDTGMGLERLAMVCQKKSSVFETDLFLPIINEIRNPKYEIRDTRYERVIADHIKSAVFLISEGVFPSNVERGYVLRRLLRRAIRSDKLLSLPPNFLIPLARKVIEIYKNEYPEIRAKETDILVVIQNEEERFEKTLEIGLKNFKSQIENCRLKGIKIIPGEIIFDLYQSYGFPLELTKELANEEGFKIDEAGFKEEFKKHQEISRAGVEKKFGGVGREATAEMIRHHTATHLLHAALRIILGSHVRQMGSDITPQRLRFDFSHPAKMTEEEIRKTEELVNQKIKENLSVKKEEMNYEEALGVGALAFFKEKYPAKVSVYTIYNPSNPSERFFSKEICAGPHIERTSELGHFKIIKEESSGQGVRRIRAVLDQKNGKNLRPIAIGL